MLAVVTAASPWRFTATANVSDAPFPTEEAISEARVAARTISAGHAQALDLTTSDREAFHRANQKLAALGVSLDEAVREYIEAKLLLKGQPLAPAADTYARLYSGVVTGAKVGTVAEELLKAKREYGLSKRYLKQLDSDLTRFGREFPGEIASITVGEMDRWLRSLKVSNRSRNNILTSLRTLSHFAQKRGYLPKNSPTEADALEKFKAVESPNEVFTPAQLKALLEASTGDQTIWIAVAAFAGLRAAEIARMDWSWFNFQTGFITVDARHAKTSSRRLVPITDSLRAWLEPYQKTSGRVLTDLEIWKDVTALGKKLGFGWPRNVLRNSRISYRLAETKNIAMVAEESGNSAAIIRRNYLELVLPGDATAWFAIQPPAKTVWRARDPAEI